MPILTLRSCRACRTEWYYGGGNASSHMLSARKHSSFESHSKSKFLSIMSILKFNSKYCFRAWSLNIVFFRVGNCYRARTTSSAFLEICECSFCSSHFAPFSIGCVDFLDMGNGVPMNSIIHCFQVQLKTVLGSWKPYSLQPGTVSPCELNQQIKQWYIQTCIMYHRTDTFCEM